MPTPRPNHENSNRGTAHLPPQQTRHGLRGARNHPLPAEDRHEKRILHLHGRRRGPLSGGDAQHAYRDAPLPDLSALGAVGAAARRGAGQTRPAALHEQHGARMGPHSAGADAARHHLPRKAGFAQQVVLPVAGTHLPPAGRAAHPAQVPEDHHRLAIRMRPHPHGPRSRSRTDHGHLQRLQRTVPAAGRCGADRRQIPLRSRLHLLSGQHRPQEEHVRHAARLRRVRAPLGETPAAAGRRPQGAGRGGDSARDRRARTARDAPPAGVYPQRRPPGRLQRRIGVPLHLAAREFRNSAARSDGLRHARGDVEHLGDPRSGRSGSDSRRSDFTDGDRRRPAAARKRSGVPRRTGRLH